jgi:hypothetical protein
MHITTDAAPLFPPAQHGFPQLFFFGPGAKERREMTTKEEAHKHVADLFAEFADDEVEEMIYPQTNAMSPEQLAQEFRLARDVLDGLVAASEPVGWGLYTVLVDGRARAEEALSRIEVPKS